MSGTSCFAKCEGCSQSRRRGAISQGKIESSKQLRKLFYSLSSLEMRFNAYFNEVMTHFAGVQSVEFFFFKFNALKQPKQNDKCNLFVLLPDKIEN